MLEQLVQFIKIKGVSQVKKAFFYNVLSNAQKEVRKLCKIDWK